MTARVAPTLRPLLRQLVRIPFRSRVGLAAVVIATSWVIAVYVRHKGLMAFVALLMSIAGLLIIGSLFVEQGDVQQRP
jgi:hypothetical protein